MDLSTGSMPSDTPNDQTDIERETAQFNWELLKLATFMAGSKNTSAEEVDNALCKAENWLKSKKDQLTLDEEKSSHLITKTALYLRPAAPTGPTWRYLHTVFMILESLKAASQLVSLASRKASKTVKLPKESVERLSALVHEVFELIRSNTRVLKAQILAPGVLGSLVDLVMLGNESTKYDQELQDTLDKGLDMSALEILCHSLMESWGSALDGVMAVKL